MFDCVMPTRNGRNAMLFTSQGIMNMRNKKWEDDFSPIDPTGTAWVDGFYTKAYLHHLFKAQELLALQKSKVLMMRKFGLQNDIDEQLDRFVKKGGQYAD
jgi:queuine tRNA-ribosyltransferase